MITKMFKSHSHLNLKKKSLVNGKQLIWFQVLRPSLLYCYMATLHKRGLNQLIPPFHSLYEVSAHTEQKVKREALLHQGGPN